MERVVGMEDAIPPARHGWAKEPATDWAAAASAIRKAGPHATVLLFRDTAKARALCASINQGQVRALRDLGGVVRAVMRGQTIDGTYRGNVYAAWEPDADPRSRYSERYLGAKK